APFEGVEAESVRNLDSPRGGLHGLNRIRNAISSAHGQDPSSDVGGFFKVVTFAAHLVFAGPEPERG
ncbi:MAG: hypothetical protein VCC19_08715, partial [Myxococcota bacterium]